MAVREIFDANGKIDPQFLPNLNPGGPFLPLAGGTMVGATPAIANAHTLLGVNTIRGSSVVGQDLVIEQTTAGNDINIQTTSGDAVNIDAGNFEVNVANEVIVNAGGANGITLDTAKLTVNTLADATLSPLGNLVSYDILTGELKYQPVPGGGGGVSSVGGTAPIASTGGANPVISLNTLGSASTYAYPSSITTDAYGRISSITAGSAPVASVSAGSNISLTGTSSAPIINVVSIPTFESEVLQNNTTTSLAFKDAGGVQRGLISVNGSSAPLHTMGITTDGGLEIANQTAGCGISMAGLIGPQIITATKDAPITSRILNLAQNGLLTNFVLNQNNGAVFGGASVGTTDPTVSITDSNGASAVFTKLASGPFNIDSTGVINLNGTSLTSLAPNGGVIIPEATQDGGTKRYVPEQLFFLDGVDYTPTNLGIAPPVLPSEKVKIILNGFRPSEQFQNLTDIGSQAYIPYYNNDYTDGPSAPLSAPTSHWPSLSSFPTKPSAVYYDEINHTLWVGSEGLLYSFSDDTNEWLQQAIVYNAGPAGSGVINAIYVDNQSNRVYIGGIFDNIEGYGNIGGGFNAFNVGYFDPGTGTGNYLLDSVSGEYGVDGTVYTITKFNTFIWFGGEFKYTAPANTVQVNRLGYWNPDTNRYYTCDGFPTTPGGGTGFDSAVYCLEVNPEVSALMVGGAFNQQVYTANITNYQNICALFLNQGFINVGSSIVSGKVLSLLYDPDAGLMYFGGSFTIPANGGRSDYFTYVPANNYGSAFGLTDYNSETGGSDIGFQGLTKNGVSGNIVIFEQSSLVLWEYNPITYVYTDLTSIYGVPNDITRITYDPYASALIYCIRSVAVFRNLCSQTYKVIQDVKYQGTRYNAIVMRKLNSCVVLTGENNYGEWSLESKTDDVYFEMKSHAIIPPVKAYGTAYANTNQQIPTGGGSLPISFDEIGLAKDVYASSVPFNEATVKQTGKYKVSFSLQLDKTSGGADKVVIYPTVRGFPVLNSSSEVVINGPNDESFPYVEFILTLRAYDSVGMVMYSTDDTVLAKAVSATGAPSYLPSIPAVIMNIEQIDSSRQIVYKL